jgi:hypothetical protein
MPRIRIILEDDEGNPLSDAGRAYRLEGDLDTLDGIERAVETFKERAFCPRWNVPCSTKPRSGS